MEEEPPYISRVELLKHLQLKSLEALSAASDKSQSPDSDSDASTVKNEKSGSNNSNKGQTRKWLSQKLQFEKNMISAIRDNKVRHDISTNDSNNNISSQTNNEAKLSISSGSRKLPNEPDKKLKSSAEMPSKPARSSSKMSNKSVRSPAKYDVSDHEWDTCSCVTCNTCQQSDFDCSCSDISESSNVSKSSHSSDGSVETIVDAQAEMETGFVLEKVDVGKNLSRIVYS